MSNKRGKIWGNTELVHANGVLEFHRIEFEEGMRCSKHMHQTKHNGFWVEEGILKVRVWQQREGGPIDTTTLHKGDWCTVPPGKYHEFVGVKSGVAFELYWAEFNPEDIVREDVGGKFIGDYTKD